MFKQLDHAGRFVVAAGAFLRVMNVLFMFGEGFLVSFEVCACGSFLAAFRVSVGFEARLVTASFLAYLAFERVAYLVEVFVEPVRPFGFPLATFADYLEATQLREKDLLHIYRVRQRLVIRF